MKWAETITKKKMQTNVKNCYEIKFMGFIVQQLRYIIFFVFIVLRFPKPMSCQMHKRITSKTAADFSLRKSGHYVGVRRERTKRNVHAREPPYQGTPAWDLNVDLTEWSNFFERSPSNLSEVVCETLQTTSKRNFEKIPIARVSSPISVITLPTIMILGMLISITQAVSGIFSKLILEVVSNVSQTASLEGPLIKII